MNKKISLGVCIALMAIVATITLSLTYVITMEHFNSMVHNVFERQQMYLKLSEIDQKVRQNYLGNIDETALNDALAEGFMDGSGDKYGSYLSAEQYKNTLSGLEGTTIGIGIVLRENTDGSILITGVNQGSPAATAGLAVGDVITGVDDKVTEEMSFSEVYEAMQGEVGSKVKLTVKRADGEKIFEVTRKQYEIVSVESRVIKQNVGYVKILEFNDNTEAQFTDAIRKLQDEGVVGILFDVRDNPGGTLPAVSGILDLLLPAGNIVSSTDKAGNTTVLYTSDSRQINLPMSVLMNEGTASAAELFASALKDYKKATLVGTITRGKGTMQKMFPLLDGSALNITVAKFNPPSSENFDGIGIIPDITSTLTEEQIYNFHALTEDTDPQILAAVTALALTGATPEDIGVAPPSSAPPESSDASAAESGSDTSAAASGSDTSASAAGSSDGSSSGGFPSESGSSTGGESSSSSSGATSPTAFYYEGRLFFFV